MLRKIVFLFLVLQGGILFPLDRVLAGTATVAVIPFRMNAGEPIGFIGDGIRDMLSSRIGSEPAISVVKQSLVTEALAKASLGELTEEKAVDLGRTLQVAYVVFGSISKIGANLSVDLNLLDLEEGGTLISVFTQSMGLDEVVPHMNVLAKGITEAIDTRRKTSPEELPLAGTPSADTAGTQPLGNIGALFRKTPGTDDLLDDGKNELEFEEAGRLFETGETSPPEIIGAEKTEPATAEADESEQENVAERLLKRRSPIDSTDENPAYQKSIDDLEDSSERVSGETPQ